MKKKHENENDVDPLKMLLPPSGEIPSNNLLDITKEFFTANSQYHTELEMKSDIAEWQLGAVLATTELINVMAEESGYIHVFENADTGEIIIKDEGFNLLDFVPRFLKLRTSIKGKRTEQFKETLAQMTPSMKEIRESQERDEIV